MVDRFLPGLVPWHALLLTVLGLPADRPDTDLRMELRNTNITIR
jgi:hypothetical protein